MDKSGYDTARGSLGSYVTGFVLSLILTLVVYSFVAQHALASRTLIAIILSLALVQFVVQLIFFLHLARESKPRWNLVVLLFMAMVLVIVVFGSLWIMNHLNYNMLHSPKATDTYIIKDEGIKY